MYQIALTLHLLGTIVWVGGMFFAHMALRPAAQELLEPPQRLPLLKRVLDRFFQWVWAAILLILTSGYWIFFATHGGKTLLYVHIMSGIGLVMTGLFAFLYFGPYRKMGRALAAGDLPAAGAAMALIRRIIGINLVLGLIEAVLGASRPF
jgi:uncharacterized membrane protein